MFSKHASQSWRDVLGRPLPISEKYAEYCTGQYREPLWRWSPTILEAFHRVTLRYRFAVTQRCIDDKDILVCIADMHSAVAWMS